jgi:hypothetical protein
MPSASARLRATDADQRVSHMDKNAGVLARLAQRFAEAYRSSLIRNRPYFSRGHL